MADFAKWGEAISRAMGYTDFEFLDAYAENRNQQNVVAVEENFIGSIFVRFYQDYEIRNRANPTFVGSPDLLYISIIDFAEANQININNRQFPKAPNILVKKLKSLQLNLREAFAITLDIERDNSNNSVLTIYRKKPSINHPNRYYEIMIQNRHLQNQNYISSQTPRNNEVTSGASMPPIEIAPSNGIGGSEVPEVTYVTSGVADTTKSQDVVKSDVVTRDKLTHVGDNETEELDIRVFEN
jgi:hypothetical protein